MALPSSLYAEDTSARQTLANGTELKWTNQVGNLYGLNSATDLSICYCSWSDPDALTIGTKTLYNYYESCDASLPDLGPNESGVANNVASGWTRSEAMSPRVRGIYSGVVISNNNNGAHYWGYNPLSNTKYNTGNGNTARFLLDMDINKMIFRISFSAIKLSDLPDADDIAANPTTTHYPSPVTISLKELYDHPDWYGIVDYSLNGCMVYGENTADHWRSASLIPSFLQYCPDYMGGFNSKHLYGEYYGSSQLSFNTPNGHVASSGGTYTGPVISHLDEPYVCMHPTEFVMKPSGSYDSIGQTAMVNLQSYYGTATAKTADIYTGCEIVDMGKIMYVIFPYCTVRQTVSPAYKIDYSTLKIYWRKLVKGSAMLEYIASFGLYFSNDSGYDPDTDSLTPETLGDSDKIWLGEMFNDGTTSGRWITDLDSYHGPNKDGKTSNPDYKPGGGGGGDDDDPSDDQVWGGAYSGAGAFSKFYLCTATDLANLRTWFGGGGTGDQIPDGFDPMGQVLGLLQYPISISGTALAPDEIVFRSGKTIIHTGVNADRSTGGFLHLNCGSVDIPRRMQERGVPFLDFETTLEIYVPFCGTAPLDVQACVGKTLTCDLYVATATGDVSAVIAAGGHPVAYMSGNMAESLPISSGGYGMYLAACKSTWGNGVSQTLNQLTGGTVSTIKNVNQAALNETLSYSQTGGFGQSELLAESYNNPAVGRSMAGLASARGAAGIGLLTTGLNVANAASTGYEQYQRVKNASYTSVSGSFTSCAAWNYPFTPYVKITRPHKQIPDNYKHTAAIPLVETRNLSGAPGLTTCVNPDVSGIANATAQEKDIIYRALVNGVIV